MNKLNEIFGEIISSYSRKQALEDGFLHEVPKNLCKEAGFVYPVAITNSIAVIIEETLKKNDVYDYEGILWDILSVLKYAIRRSPGGDRVNFTVKIGRKNISMYSTVTGGDNGEPVITIMLPNED